jgi:NAD(P)-dependent dehydrogenase (short-subunit alcohol dehydrogenase family)
MSSLLSKRLRYYFDGLLSLLTILVARLLPTLPTPSPTDLTSRTAIITGGNSGLGFSLALSLASQNATVYLACRNASKAHAAAAQIVDVTGCSSKNIRVLELDTSSMASVRAFAETCSSKSIDLLFHNAGITAPSQNTQHTTPEGLGTIYATNFAGSFLLTSLLERHLAPSARVIFTSSTAQYGASPLRIFDLPRLDPGIDGASKPTNSALYADTKSMQSTFASLLNRRFSSSPNRRTAHVFLPGYTSTPIFDKTPAQPWYRDPFFWLLKACTVICVPVEEGAKTGLWLATTEDERVVGEGKGGECWDRCVRRSTAVDVLGSEVLERMWRVWEEDTGAEWK